jgi:hypothetical protein
MEKEKALPTRRKSSKTLPHISSSGLPFCHAVVNCRKRNREVLRVG